MKLPPLTAEHGPGPATITYAATRISPGARATRPGTIAPMATLACLSTCVGSDAASKCAAQCGSDLTCWRACAGLSDTSCIAACLRS